MNNKRGQAALEFLMTYGWAILVVLIAIGALAYFGVLNPKGILPKSCILAPGFNCDDFIVKSDGTGTFIIRNGIGKSLVDYALVIESVNATCTLVDANGTTWKAGRQLNCNFVGLTTGTEGNSYSQDMVLWHKEEGAELLHRENGKVATKYE
ncbi:MAG TPA: hypothetical protein VJB94_01790 [Candidatus Nanoarchaeia archaeon]|nr:hypothetical protein [Candidatus Nanoarchaeia archaeon]